MTLFRSKQGADVSETSTASYPRTSVSWEELHRTAKVLAWRLIERGPFDGVVAITRGGLVPAAIVARELEIQLIDTVCVVTYDEQERGEPRVTKSVDIPDGGAKWLIVDDPWIPASPPRSSAACYRMRP